jgi:hypothetical protein
LHNVTHNGGPGFVAGGQGWAGQGGMQWGFGRSAWS